MAVTSGEPTRENHNDQYPLLMERDDGHVNEEHIIDIQRGGEPSSSGSSDFEFSGGRHYHDGRVMNNTQLPVSVSSPSSPSQTNSRSSSFTRRSEGIGRRNWSPFNSGFWIMIESIFTLSLIIASITVLCLSRDEHPRAPLFSWVVGYTAGCLASLPILYWRFLHRNQSTVRSASQSSSASPHANSAPDRSSYTTTSLSRSSEQEADHNASGPAFEGQTPSRFGRIMDHIKMALDCFFVVWFIVGTVWIFGGHATAAEAPNLYRLCIVYLTFSCIGYAMPFILCAMVCCCLPCIISVLGIREELNQVRGASDESISALPTYKFKVQKEGNCTGDPNDEEGGGGVVAAGTEKERVISGEDAICCICLTRYMDDEELRELPCTHFFHAECVDRWLKINATCPLCKFEICEREENTTPSETHPANET
ncbi:hypothetical protein Cgig2_018623 [Carnegiea gigantea]|uniref:RING-type domain-containing protein n=1 Tax=Carnegiea gigantea TaxID=171969 RepID=A0A9Q1KGK7_9CARY|nr:hypothetical protein Cgig2_018623 [Carnegiea gigantea]